jgi:hypothetical protein
VDFDSSTFSETKWPKKGSCAQILCVGIGITLVCPSMTCYLGFLVVGIPEVLVNTLDDNPYYLPTPRVEYKLLFAAFACADYLGVKNDQNDLSIHQCPQECKD